jgi:hypothetical protein
VHGRKPRAVEVHAHDIALLLFLGVRDFGFEHETVHLRLGQRVGALLLQRVLGGQHQERLGQRVGLVADGHLTLLHGFEQGALHLGRRAVDFVRKHEVGEDRPLADGELLVALRVDQRADEVGGQQVGGELDARETGIDGFGQRGDGERLGQSGHPFEQDVAVGEQADEQRVHQVGLSHDDLAHLRAERIHENAFALDALVEFLDVDDFAHECLVFCFSVFRGGYSVQSNKRMTYKLIANLEIFCMPSRKIPHAAPVSGSFSPCPAHFSLPLRSKKGGPVFRLARSCSRSVGGGVTK